MTRDYMKIKGANTKIKFLRKMEFISEHHCLICNKPFITNHYWSYGGTKPSFDHWIIGSVYCSTKCSRKGHKLFKENEE